MSGLDTQLVADIQQLKVLLFGFAVAFIGFAVWFVRYYWPRVLEQRRLQQEKASQQELEKSANEIKRQRELFEEELAKRRQERQMEYDQQKALWESMTQVLSAHAEGARNYAALAQRMLDQTVTVAGELHGHKTLLTDVSETVDAIYAEFGELKSQIESIVVSVQNNTHASQTTNANVSHMLTMLGDFGKKLDGFVQQVKHDTKELPPVQPVNPPSLPEINPT